MKKIKVVFYIVCLLYCLSSCEKILPAAPESNQILDGPLEGLNSSQALQHLKGDQLFNDKIFDSESGLGPLFIASSCGSCHVGDGKGHPFTSLTRFGQMDSTGNKFLKQGAPLLHTRALPGYQPEVMPAGATSTRLTPPIVAGVGFLDFVTDADIMAMSDPDDLDGDGISGVPNWNFIPSYIILRQNTISRAGKYICRFGKKGAVYNLLHQTVTALNQDIGITSIFNPLDAYSLKEIDPEISSSSIYDLVFYLQTLKAPERREAEDEKIILGRNIFINTGCSDCHKPVLKTGYSEIEALSNKEFHPYTDLLLHDMGIALDDGYTEGNAGTSEWRTAPLWGLGLASKSQGGEYFLLHDGRAKSIEEAISFHGGEAGSRRSKFDQLSASDKQLLINFLKSL